MELLYVSTVNGPMGRITINKITHVEYTTIVSGNGGEEQLVIVSSWGQSGSCDLHIVATSVDGGRSGKSYWRLPYGKSEEEIFEFIRQSAREWLSHKKPKKNKIIDTWVEEGAEIVVKAFKKSYE